MRSKKACLGILMSVVSVGVFTLGGCTKDDDDDPAPATTKTNTLSASFATNCAGCHGSSGQGGSGPKLQGTSKTEAQFTSTVRTGITGKMGAFDSDTYSNADLKADYAELTK